MEKILISVFGDHVVSNLKQCLIHFFFKKKKYLIKVCDKAEPKGLVQKYE
jgi:hypothetical protein